MKPILFNTEMVRAILEDRKTVTRRVMKPQPRAIYYDGKVYDDDGLYVVAENQNGGVEQIELPYRPGDILYVRETWAVWSPTYGTIPEIIYKADGYSQSHKMKWRPSIHMPREAARIFLRVTDVRVERLQDITDDGAIQEGIQYTDFGTYLPNWKMSIDGGKTFHNPQKEIHHPGYHVGNANTPDQCYPTAKGAYHALWDSTIKPADRALYGWEANPWVWVIGFERISKVDMLKEGAVE